MTDIVKILEGELDRIAEALPTLDPVTTEYTAAVCNLGEVYYRICNFKVPNGLTLGTTDSVVRATVAEPENPAPVEEPAPAPAPKTDTTDWGAYRVSLRERLADSRIKGVNITALLTTMGAGKLSSVPDERLPELSDLLDEALKELS